MEDHESKDTCNSNRESETILSGNLSTNDLADPKDEHNDIPVPPPNLCQEVEKAADVQCNGSDEPNLDENAIATNNLAFLFDKQSKNGGIATNLSYLNNNIPDSSKEPHVGLNSELELGLGNKNNDDAQQCALSKTENILEPQGQNEVVNEEKKLPNDPEPKEELPEIVNEVQNVTNKPDDKLPTDKEKFGDIKEIVQKILREEEERKQQAALEEKKRLEELQATCEKKEPEEDFEIFEDKGDEPEEKEEEVQEIPRRESPDYDIYEDNDDHDSHDNSKYSERYLTIDLYDCDSDDEPVPSDEEFKLLYDSSEIETDEGTQDSSSKRKLDDNEDSVSSCKKFKIEDDVLLIDEQPDFITMTVHTDKEGTRTVETEETSREIPLEDEPPVEKFEPFIIQKIQHREEVEYKSQDPKENEDNYNKEWLKLKERICGNEVERYKAIRERWRNLSIPNPNVNLTYRHVNNSIDEREKNEPNNNITRGKNHQRSRSCTTFYENIISEVNNKYQNEKQKIMDQYNLDRRMTDQAKEWELKLALLNVNNPIGQQNLRLTLYKHQQVNLFVCLVIFFILF